MMKEGSVPIPCSDKKGIRLKLVSLPFKTHKYSKNRDLATSAQLKNF